MTDLFSITPSVKAAAAPASAQRVNENFTRQAAQIKALEALPDIKTETPRAVNPTPISKGYDRHGDVENEEEPTGSHFSATA